jgi:hypothetical protein
MTAADRDGNGECTVAELAAVPGLALKEALADLDTDKNGSLSEKEIVSWLSALRATKIAVETATVRILQKGEPLPRVRVQIVPEPCMGNTVLPAEGKTLADGVAILRIPSIPYGAHFGIYRLKVTGQDRSGKPLGAQYNSKSSLGLIVPLVGRTPTYDLEWDRSRKGHRPQAC